MKEELLQILTEAVPGVDFEAETALEIGRAHV